MGSTGVALNTNPVRLPEVIGFNDRKNDIVYGAPLVNTDVSRVVVFFPGDVQDYLENMEAHRDNKHHKQWNLVDTAIKLQKKFSKSHVLVIKPSRMDYKTFSCFQNFVRSNQLGVPDHTPNYDSLKHMDSLVKCVSDRLATSANNTIPNLLDTNLVDLNLELIGFSKGCVVLNQFLHEFHTFNTVEKKEDVLKIIYKIRDMYWLDGGHSGGKQTWINDKDILKTLCSLDINVHIHVTPYQIQDDRRPWIRKEEKAFSDYLLKLGGGKVDRTIHFDNIAPSITTHFDVINVFKAD